MLKNTCENQSRSDRRRLRLKAGALALSFAFLSLLPWFHVLTPDAQHGHACCHHAAAEPPAGDAPAMDLQRADASGTCWVCQSLASLLQHHERTDVPAFVWLSSSSPYVARAPHAPTLIHIYPASRSQAPPAFA